MIKLMSNDNHARFISQLSNINIILGRRDENKSQLIVLFELDEVVRRSIQQISLTMVKPFKCG